jgi:hypothetical protein
VLAVSTSLRAVLAEHGTFDPKVGAAPVKSTRLVGPYAVPTDNVVIEFVNVMHPLKRKVE